jgi:BMFP domain-containing protein YqiC
MNLDKMPLIAIVVSLLALAASGYTIFMMTSNESVTKEDFDVFKNTAMKGVNEAIEVSRTDIEAIKTDIQGLRQVIEANKQELVNSDADVSQKISNITNEIFAKLNVLQASMKKAPPAKPAVKKPAAPAPAVKTKQTAKPSAKPVKKK